MTGPGSVTVIDEEPAAAIEAEETEAVSCEVDTKLVVRAVPFQLTVAPETKPDPFTVSVKVEPPARVDAGLKLDITGGPDTVNVDALDVTGPELTTVTETLPADAT